MTNLHDIQHRRAQLLARATAQRGEVAMIFQRLDMPLRLADSAISYTRFFKAHPLVPVAVIAGLVVAWVVSSRVSVPRTLKRVFIGAAALWRMYRSLGGWIAYGRIALLGINAMRRNSGNKNNQDHPYGTG